VQELFRLIKIQNSAPSGKQPSPSASTRTAKATAARLARYDAHVRAIVPALAQARAFHVDTAVNLANWLDCHGVPAPDGGPWSKSTMLRALRRLRRLGLEPETVKPVPTVLDLTKKSHLAIFNEVMKGKNG
jgi:hypothetical protein